MCSYAKFSSAYPSLLLEMLHKAQPCSTANRQRMFQEVVGKYQELQKKRKKRSQRGLISKAKGIIIIIA